MIATTSSSEKEKLLRELGADVVINYKTTPEWGAAAYKAAPGGVGVDHIIEIGSSCLQLPDPNTPLTTTNPQVVTAQLASPGKPSKPKA